MPIATGLALGLAGISAAGAIGGAAISSSGANAAAGAQSNAANYAANLQHQDAQSALQFQQQQLAQQQQNIAPWLQTGRGALSQLSSLMGISPVTSQAPGTQALSGSSAQQTVPFGVGAGNSSRTPLSALRGDDNLAGTTNTFSPSNTLRAGNENGVVPTGTTPAQGGFTPTGFGSLLQGYDKQFVAPTAATEQNDPGYKFRLDQGMQALQNSAAARGGLLSGNTAKAVNDYAQNYASNEYSNVYSRSLGEYQQGYNIFENNQANKFNRLSALSGTGQTAASQLNSASQGAAGNVSNILLGSGQQIGQDIQNAGAATASGYAAGANAFGGAVSGIGSNLTNLLLLSQLTGKH